MIASKRTLERGQALVEMAFFLLLFLLIVFMIVDLGRAVYDYSVVYNAAREGARAGIIPLDYDPVSINYAAINSAVYDRAVGVDIVFDSDTDANWNEAANTISVTVRTTFTPVTPLISALTGGDINISSTVTMNLER